MGQLQENKQTDGKTEGQMKGWPDLNSYGSKIRPQVYQSNFNKGNWKDKCFSLKRC